MSHKKKCSGFSKAARLYAEYEQVVQSVRQACMDDINAFLEDLCPHLQKQVSAKTISFVESRSPQSSYLYWYIGKEEDNKDDYPQLQLRTDDVGIVSPGRMSLVAVAPKARGQQLTAVVQVSSDRKWSTFCGPLAGGPWSLFTYQVEVKKGEDLAEIAKNIAGLLRAMNTAYRTNP
jgi:hypothetical protein